MAERGQHLVEVNAVEQYSEMTFATLNIQKVGVYENHNFWSENIRYTEITRCGKESNNV